jgi:hypothetical protein
VDPDGSHGLHCPPPGTFTRRGLSIIELGSPIHSNGVLMLSGFLAGRYIPDHPLSLSASIVFEQSYGAVEGDSASSAELYALLSTLADVPVKQSIAVTGSINQHGKVQIHLRHVPPLGNYPRQWRNLPDRLESVGAIAPVWPAWAGRRDRASTLLSLARCRPEHSDC